LSVNPKPDIKEKFTWNPKLTFITGVIFTILLIISYLGFQYKEFVEPPFLSVEVPTDDQLISETTLLVMGKTDSDASVTVNNQPAFISENGSYTSEIEIFEGTSEITIVAKSRSGKETVIRRRIKPDLD
jgi:hypothetical protein